MPNIFYIYLTNGNKYAMQIGYNFNKYRIKNGYLYKGFKKLGYIEAIRENKND